MKSFFQMLGKWYCKVCEAGSYLQSPLLLLVRGYWGYHFFQAGWGKFLNLERTAGFFTTLGIPLPEFNAYLVASIETFGGLMLLIGLGARLAALPLTIIMIMAYCTAHFKAIEKLLDDPTIFLGEAPFLYLYAALIVLSFGPGMLSVDGLMGYFGKGKK